MKREEIKTLYSIERSNGTLILRKRDLDWLKRKGGYSNTFDTYINPNIKIGNNGVLTVSGLRFEFEFIKNNRGWDWIPTPLTELSEGWEDKIFFDKEKDIIEEDVVKWSWKWPFRTKTNNVKHLEVGRYLKTDGKQDTQTTSNYRLIGYKSTETKGII